MEFENKCELCNKSFPTLDDYNNHLLTYNHWKNINSFSRAKAHVKANEKISQSQSSNTGHELKGRKENANMQDNYNKYQMKENSFTCELCCKSWQSHNEYNHHMLNFDHWKNKSFHANMEDCRSLNKTNETSITNNSRTSEIAFNDDSKKTNHSTTPILQREAIEALLVEDLENCKLCGTRFSSAEMARMHYDGLKHQKKVMFAKDGMEKCIGECKICNKFFIGVDQQINHFKSVKHLLKAGAIKETEENVETECQREAIRAAKRCKLCDKFFLSIDQADKHLESIQHKKKFVLSKAKEKRDQKTMNSTDKRLVETSQELIVSYLAATSDPEGLQILESKSPFSSKDIVALLEKAIEYAVINTFSCDICKKNFNGLNHSKIHLTKSQHICRVEDAKTLFTDGSFALYQQEKPINSNEIADIVGAQLSRPNIVPVASFSPIQQPTLRGLMPTVSEGQNPFINRADEPYNDKSNMSNQTEVTENFLQMLAANLTQPQGSNMRSNFSNISLNDCNNSPTTSGGSIQDDSRFNLYPQNNLSSVAQYPKVVFEDDGRNLSSSQMSRRDFHYQNKRDRSAVERDYRFRNERDKQSSVGGSSKRRHYQAPFERDRSRTRWDKPTDSSNSREETNTQMYSDSNNYRGRQFGYNATKSERFSSKWN